MDMNQIFNIGDIIGGYCNGYFGRDDYKNKRCIMITKKYAVFERDDGTATILNYSPGLEDDVKSGNWDPMEE